MRYKRNHGERLPRGSNLFGAIIPPYKILLISQVEHQIKTCTLFVPQMANSRNRNLLLPSKPTNDVKQSSLVSPTRSATPPASSWPSANSLPSSPTTISSPGQSPSPLPRPLRRLSGCARRGPKRRQKPQDYKKLTTVQKMKTASQNLFLWKRISRERCDVPATKIC